MKYFLIIIVLVIGCSSGAYYLQNNKQTQNNIIDIVPHRAEYSVEMISTRSGTNVADIDGKMTFESALSCEAWLSSHQFNLRYSFTDAPGYEIRSDYTTFEDLGGKRFDFYTKRARDGNVYETIRGQADTKTATYTTPENLSFTFDDIVYFPMQHTRGLLHAAMTGEKFFYASVFDGSDLEGVVEINAVIGPVQHNNKETQMDSWPIRLAFFNMNDESGVSDYEMSMILQENGIVTSATIDYDEFSVHQTLQDLEILQKPDC